MEHRLDLAAAGRYVGLSTDAIRQRVKRKSLPATKGADGRWYVLARDLDALKAQLAAEADAAQDATRGQPRDDQSALVEQLRSENAFLREELRQEREGRGVLARQQAEAERRRDILFAQFADQLKMLSQTATQVQEAVATVAQEVVPEPAPEPETAHDGFQPSPSWWRRLLFGPSAELPR